MMKMNLTNKACKTDNLQSRILWIDAVRGIAIILVVLGHCTPPVYQTDLRLSCSAVLSDFRVCLE